MSNHCYDNGWIIMEADRVYNDMEAHKGLVILNDKWEVMAVIDRDGNLWVKGFVTGLHEFRAPTVAKPKSEMEADFYGTPDKFVVN